MNWISDITPPGMKKLFRRDNVEKSTEPAKPAPPARPGPGDEALWVKCPETGELLYKTDLERELWVTPSGYHMRLQPKERFEILFDNAEWEEIEPPLAVADPLRFKDDKKYLDRIHAARAKTGRSDAMAIGIGKVGGVESVVLVQDFSFMGGSLGMAAGEGFIRAAELAIAKQAAFICVTAAGGARMQEGVLSLMQMPRTTLAVDLVRDAGLPYIVILTDPTTGGVTASYAMLGDVQIAEPNALIGFAGQRVIEQTIRQKLPEGFQRSEYLKEKGMLDMVLDRRELKGKLALILQLLMNRRSITPVHLSTADKTLSKNARE